MCLELISVEFKTEFYNSLVTVSPGFNIFQPNYYSQTQSVVHNVDYELYRLDR
jgi:hypothetical protein